MSANNMITINKKTFVVMNVDAETGYGSIVGKGKNWDDFRFLLLFRCSLRHY